MKSKLKRAKAQKKSVLKKMPAKKMQQAEGTILMRRKTDQQLLMSVDFLISGKVADVVGTRKNRRKNDAKSLENFSDIELVGFVQKGNKAAYEELFGRYQKKLFIYVYHLIGSKEEVEDLLQNVFSKTYRSIARFDLQRKFSSWIYRIAHNEAVNFLKRRSKKHFISWEDISTTKDKLDTQSDEKLPEEKWILKELTEEVDKALENLPEKYKQVLLMRYFSEYSYENIAKILKKPVNTVGTLINRAKKKMMEEMAKIEQERH